MNVDDCLKPALAREVTYELLAQSSPAKVVIDTSLATGSWYVVRAPYEWERGRLAQLEPGPKGGAA